MQKDIRLEDDTCKNISNRLYRDNISTYDAVSPIIKKCIDKRNDKCDFKYESYSFIDLFAGIGGLRMAYENAGGHCVYSNEWNKYSRQTYYANFGELPDDDITKVDENSIPDHDILVAGFPCQPFSIAGISKKNSLGRATGFEDKTQGTLFFDVCRILKHKRPKSFMLENVKNLVSHDHGKTFKVIMESLDELHYEVFYAIVDGKLYVPQHRERIVIVGFDRKRYGNDIDFSIKLTPAEKRPVLYWNDQISGTDIYNRSAYNSRQTMQNSTYLCVQV